MPTPQIPGPKEMLTQLLAPLTQMEASFKKPLIDAGFPEIPSPAEFFIRMAEALPELPALPGLAPPTAPPVEVPTEALPLALPARIKYG